MLELAGTGSSGHREASGHFSQKALLWRTQYAYQTIPFFSTPQEDGHMIHANSREVCAKDSSMCSLKALYILLIFMSLFAFIFVLMEFSDFFFFLCRGNNSLGSLHIYMFNLLFLKPWGYQGWVNFWETRAEPGECVGDAPVLAGGIIDYCLDYVVWQGSCWSTTLVCLMTSDGGRSSVGTN